MKVSAVNSAQVADSVGTMNTFYDNYAVDKNCSIYANCEVVVSISGMLMDISAAIMQVTVSVALMQFLQQCFRSGVNGLM